MSFWEQHIWNVNLDNTFLLNTDHDSIIQISFLFTPAHIIFCIFRDPSYTYIPKHSCRNKLMQAVAYRGLLAPRQEVILAPPLRNFFPENFLKGRSKTNLNHFQKWKAKKKKSSANLHTVSSLSFQALAEPTTLQCFSHYYLYIRIHDLTMWKVVGLFLLKLGRFQRPPKVAPGARAPPLPSPRYTTAFKGAIFLQFELILIGTLINSGVFLEINHWCTRPFLIVSYSNSSLLKIFRRHLSFLQNQHT